MPAVRAHRLLLLALLVGAAALLLAVVVFGDGSAVDVARSSWGKFAVALRSSWG
jgi:hypothetical protein